MKDSRILIVDDNQSILRALEMMLKYRCIQVDTFLNPDQAFNAFKKNEYDAILLDMNFRAGVNTGNEGIYWLEKFYEIKPNSSIIMMTAYGDIDLAVNAIKKGAVDFVLKPWDNEKLLATLHSAINLSRSRNEVRVLKKKEKELISVLNNNNQTIIGKSTAINQVMNLIKKVAATDVNVFILGENGTGKELVAREIHRLSMRSEKPLVTIDMGSITETLFESELFGHKKGAFTDAKEDRLGKFEVASGGSLFLDEIGNLTLPLQAKLLTVLQNRTITRVGENRPIPIDIRLISATNSNIETMVSNSDFREDLLYRLNTITIEVPPLRERSGDILLLTHFFLNKYASKYNKKGLKISASALAKLESYNWPGNVRELQHMIEKSVILADSNQLKAIDFNLKNTMHSKSLNTKMTIEEMEFQMIEMAILRCNGNFSAAANALGITRQTMYNKMKKYDL